MSGCIVKLINDVRTSDRRAVVHVSWDECTDCVGFCSCQWL